MIFDESFRKKIEETLNKLPFVTWDRFVKNKDKVTIFGWIPRSKDSYKDFVVLQFTPEETNFIATSSAEHSEQIGQVLKTGHVPCERAETFFKEAKTTKEVRT